jgi:hypothetical protein
VYPYRCTPVPWYALVPYPHTLAFAFVLPHLYVIHFRTMAKKKQSFVTQFLRHIDHDSFYVAPGVKAGKLLRYYLLRALEKFIEETPQEWYQNKYEYLYLSDLIERLQKRVKEDWNR